MEDIKEVNKALKVLSYLCHSVRTAPAAVCCMLTLYAPGFSPSSGEVCACGGSCHLQIKCCLEPCHLMPTSDRPQLEPRSCVLFLCLQL